MALGAIIPLLMKILGSGNVGAGSSLLSAGNSAAGGGAVSSGGGSFLSKLGAGSLGGTSGALPDVTNTAGRSAPITQGAERPETPGVLPDITNTAGRSEPIGSEGKAGGLGKLISGIIGGKGKTDTAASAVGAGGGVVSQGSPNVYQPFQISNAAKGISYNDIISRALGRS